MPQHNVIGCRWKVNKRREFGEKGAPGPTRAGCAGQKASTSVDG